MRQEIDPWHTLWQHLLPLCQDGNRPDTYHHYNTEQLDCTTYRCTKCIPERISQSPHWHSFTGRMEWCLWWLTWQRQWPSYTTEGSIWYTRCRLSLELHHTWHPHLHWSIFMPQWTLHVHVQGQQWHIHSHFVGGRHLLYWQSWTILFSHNFFSHHTPQHQNTQSSHICTQHIILQITTQIHALTISIYQQTHHMIQPPPLSTSHHPTSMWNFTHQQYVTNKPRRHHTHENTPLSRNNQLTLIHCPPHEDVHKLPSHRGWLH